MENQELKNRNSFDAIPDILVVDDLPENLHLLLNLLSKKGYEVRPTPSASLALQAIKYQTPDLILLDVRMPKMSGLELCRLLKNNEKTCDVPVIFISALGEAQDKVDAFQAGGVDYITKPFQEEEVLARVKTHLQIRRLQKQEQLNTQLLEEEVEKRTNELLESEERYYQLVQNLPVGIWRTTPDEEGRYLMANSALVGIFGCGTLEKLLKMKASDFYKDPMQRRRFADSVIKQGLIEGKELELKKLDGTPITGLVTAQAIKDNHGKPLFIDGFVLDITEQKRVEKENKKLADQLMHSQKLEAIGTLAGGIAHDFNNILTAVLGYTELAIERAPEMEQSLKSDLSHVINAGLRAKELVTQILQFSRHADTNFKPVVLENVLKEVVALLKASLPATIEITTNMEVASNTVFADESQVHQIFMNLCTNAFHAMKEKGGTLGIELTIERLENHLSCQGGQIQPGEYAVLVVRDSGHGMAPDTVSRIFEPYFTTKEKGEGTGLGLAVTNSIVKSHKGGVLVESKIGVGTTFKVYFPIETAEQNQDAADHSAIQGGNERILFVDDEDFFADLFSRILSTLGYKMTTTNNSINAFELFASDPDQFDLLITDQTMPGTTGLELVQKVHEINPEFPVIICTGFSENIVNKTSEEIGVSDIIYKPATKKDLAISIRKVLDHGQCSDY